MIYQILHYSKDVVHTHLMGFPTNLGRAGGMILPQRKPCFQGAFLGCLAHPPQRSALQSSHGNREGRWMTRGEDPVTRDGSFVRASRDSPQPALSTCSALEWSVRSSKEHSCSEPLTFQSRTFLCSYSAVPTWQGATRGPISKPRGNTSHLSWRCPNTSFIISPLAESVYLHDAH